LADVVTGRAPNAPKVSSIIWPGGTRIFMPAKSSGETIGRDIAATCRMPLSKPATGNRCSPLAAISCPIYRPSGPSIALCASDAFLYFSHWWIYDPNGLGIPTDFVNVWAAGKLVLDGHPAQAYDWDIQKQVEVALLGQDFPGYFAWHYPPPFLFVAALLAQFPYAVAFIGWVVSLDALSCRHARDRRPPVRLDAGDRLSDGVQQRAGRAERLTSPRR
jgi:hypothetical protein